MLFVLNTGRAGSRSIANVLSQHPELICTHEPLPRLIEETAAYRYGRMSEEELSSVLAETRPASIDGRRYCESANRLSLAIPVLAETFPDAQFVWLMRDGREVVSSAMQRGWFDPDVVKDTPWERHRLRGDELGEIEADEWARWTPFRRICWLWRRTNELISADLGALDPTRSMRVRIEDLQQQMPEVANFLDIAPIDWVVPRQNARAALPDTGAGTANQIKQRFEGEHWDDEQRDVFATECGELMDDWYPGWRQGNETTISSSAVGNASDAIDSARVDIADLRVLRGELSLLTAHVLRVDRRVAHSASQRDALTQRLHKAEDRLNAARDSSAAAERTAASLSRKLDATEDSNSALKQEAAALRESNAAMSGDLKAAQKRIKAIETSESFRLGHAVVGLPKLPKRLIQAARWRLRRLGRKFGVVAGSASESGSLKATQSSFDGPATTDADSIEVAPSTEVGFGDLDRLDSRVIEPGALTKFRLTVPSELETLGYLDDALATLREDGVGELLVPASTSTEAVTAVLARLAEDDWIVECEPRETSVALVVRKGPGSSTDVSAAAVMQAARVVAELEVAREQTAKLRKSMAQEKKSHEQRLEKAHDSTQYRLGAALLGVAKNPIKLAKLPQELWRLQARRSSAPHLDLPATSDIKPALDFKVVSILDEFTHDCFAPEFELVPLDRKSWRSQLDGAGLVFVESAWRGNGGKWNYTLNKFDQNGDDLRDVLAAAKDAGIPSLFWNKEDPISFDVFLPAAGAFDAVLTTDRDVVDNYKSALGHDRVDALAFAAQPRLHNPVGRGREVAGRLCFAGSWRGDKYAQRGNDFDILLGPPLERGALDIYDRYAGGPDEEKLGFPQPFRSAVVGSLPYSQMGNAYRRYAAFLNVNSVQDSPTMFSRRVFELLACGTPVISTPARGIDEMLGDTVLVTDSRKKTSDYVDWVLNEPEERDRFAHRGYRLVHREHSYEQRVDAMLAHVGVSPTRPRRRVSVICVSNRPEMLDHAIDSFLRQTYADKEFVFVANSSAFDSGMLESVANRVPGAKVTQIDESATLGECLNEALKGADGEYFAKFDDDDHYGDEYLSDLMMTFPYSGAAVAGKQCYYAYMESQDRTVLRFPGKEFRNAPRVVGGTIVADRSQVDGIAFESVPRGTDSKFLDAVRARGLTVFSADRFNFCQVRHADLSAHTWGIDDKEFLKACVDVGPGFQKDSVFF